MHVILKLICTLLWCVGVSTSLECESQSSYPTKLSISSRRNATGQWIAQVQLEHEAGRKDGTPWTLDIEHINKKCEANTPAVVIKATIAGPERIISSTPPLGYDLVSGMGYYKLHATAKTWHEALTTCEKEGAHLAILNSEEEAVALGIFWDATPRILTDAANNYAHIGFHDQYEEGRYVTIFNETLIEAGYAKWYNADPDGKGQNCGAVIRKSSELIDLPCDFKCGFFCERELF